MFPIRTLFRRAWLTSAVMMLTHPLALRGASESHRTDPTYRLPDLEVVSTGTRSPRLGGDSPVRTELLHPDLFLSAGLGNLASALDYLPGARVEGNCQNCGTTEVHLLGLGGAYNQVLLDGFPLFTGLASVYGLEHLPTAFIERIEVVKGGTSSLYGPGAIGGVINLLPREPIVTSIDAILSGETIRGETGHAAAVLANWVEPRQRLATSLFGEYRQQSAVDLTGDGFSDLPEKALQTIGTQWWAYPASGLRLSGHLAHTTETRRGGDRFDLVPHAAQIAEALDHDWWRGTLSAEYALSTETSVQLRAAHSHMTRDSYYGGVGDVPLPGQPGFDAEAYAEALEDSRLLYGFTRTTRTLLESSLRHHLHHHELVAGVQWHTDQIFDEKRDHTGHSLRTDGTAASATGEDPIVDGRFENFGLFLQDTWDPVADWTLITGLRFDQLTAHPDWVVSPRFALRHQMRPAWTLRGSVATGFRAPDNFDEDFHVAILDDPTRTRNAPNLDPERSLTATLGLTWSPPANPRWRVEVEAFHTQLRDSFLVPDTVLSDPNGNAYKERINAGGAVVQGAEANLLFQWSPQLSLDLGTSFVDARYDDAPEVLPGIHERRFLETPRWSSVARLNYALTPRHSFFLGLIHTGPLIAVRESAGTLNQDTGHFFVLDLSTTRHFRLGSTQGAPDLDLTLGVRNLFDQRQNDLTTGPDRDPTYVYGPRQPRTLHLALRLHY